MSRVFVYGTLKMGWGNNHRILGEAEFVGEAETLGKFKLVGTVFPYALCLDGPDTYPVRGEVYEVNQGEEMMMDILEGIPHHYQKVEVETTLGPCFMYVVVEPDPRHYKIQICPVIEGAYEWQP